MQTATNSSVKFQPWVGDHYHSSRYGVRVMVLGESHYGEPEDYSLTLPSTLLTSMLSSQGFVFSR